ALAARESQVPFYVALPLSTIDWTIDDGVKSIPIEKRSPDEVASISGRTKEGQVCKVQLTPEGSAALNYAFDVTPRHLVTVLITEHGAFRTNTEECAQLWRSVRKYKWSRIYGAILSPADMSRTTIIWTLRSESTPPIYSAGI